MILIIIISMRFCMVQIILIKFDNIIHHNGVLMAGGGGIAHREVIGCVVVVVAAMVVAILLLGWLWLGDFGWDNDIQIWPGALMADNGIAWLVNAIVVGDGVGSLLLLLLFGDEVMVVDSILVKIWLIKAISTGRTVPIKNSDSGNPLNSIANP